MKEQKKYQISVVATLEFETEVWTVSDDLLPALVDAVKLEARAHGELSDWIVRISQNGKVMD